MKKSYTLGCLVAGIVLGSAAVGQVSADELPMWGNTYQIKTGVTIERTWADIVDDGYAYDRMQFATVNSATGQTTTQVYLPYGNITGAYLNADARGINEHHQSISYNVNYGGSASTFFMMKFHFDQAIESFAFLSPAIFANLENGTQSPTAIGVNYSFDGAEWFNGLRFSSADYQGFKEFGGAATNRFTANDLNVQDLYILYYTENPNSNGSGTCNMEFRMAGRPEWGYDDFVGSQMQLWVTTAVAEVPEPASMLLLGGGALALAMSRKRM